MCASVKQNATELFLIIFHDYVARLHVVYRLKVFIHLHLPRSYRGGTNSSTSSRTNVTELQRGENAVSVFGLAEAKPWQMGKYFKAVLYIVPLFLESLSKPSVN